jgi:hypothetical protein
LARIRSVKPELRTSLTAAEWPREVRYFWVLLWGYLDDYGRGVDEPRLIKADCFPLDDDLTAADIDKWLEMFATPRDDEPASICRYKIGGRRYLHAPRWGNSQKPQHPTDSKLPKCPRGDDCGRGSRSFHESLMNPREGLSGGSPERGDGLSAASQGLNGGAEAGNEADPGVTAGQGAFMSDSRDVHESLSGNGFSNTPSPTSVRREVDGEVDGTVEGQTLKAPAKPPRDDVERLCAHLADRIEGNGANRPNITQKWRDAARLMIDRDGRTEQQVHAAIDWCQDSEFWRTNILSMPTLREQYDRLRLQAQRGHGRDSPATAPGTARAAEALQAGIAAGELMRRGAAL